MNYNKIVSKLKSNSSIYILSNLIFSLSTYLIMLVIPYYLNIDELADFTSIYQIILLYIIIFEFGLSVSYIRFKKIYDSTKYINTIVQIMILIILSLFSFTYLGNSINNIANIDKLNIYNYILFYSVFMLLSWSFFKSLLLSAEKFKTILLFSIIIFTIRVAELIIFSQNTQTINLNQLILNFFILPLFPMLVYLFYFHFHIIKSLIKIKHIKIKHIKAFSLRIKRFFKFSILTYISTIIFGFTMKLVIINLLELNEKTVLAEIGYAMTFIGIVSIFVMSIRNYFISKFSLNKKEEINNFIKKVNKLLFPIIVFSIIISLFISIIVYFIKPSYLSFNSSIYTFIIIMSYIFVSYFSMYTLLAKTFSKNTLEIKINIFRFFGVFLILYFFLNKSIILSLLFVYIFIPFMEYIYSKILISKIKLKGIKC